MKKMRQRPVLLCHRTVRGNASRLRDTQVHGGMSPNRASDSTD
jgi:hypothetical protein